MLDIFSLSFKDDADKETLWLLVATIIAAGIVYAVLKQLLRPYTSQTHSFQPTKQTRSRSERKAYSPPAGYFLNKDNLYIFTQTWLPTKLSSDNKVSGVIILLHGVGEHSGRYAGFAKRLCDTLGVAVVALDHQGHGRSEGDRLFVASFDDYLDDIERVCIKAREEFPAVPMFILGHSLGGLLAIRSVEKFPEYFSAAIFSAPALSVVASKLEMRLAPFLSHYLPHLSTSKINPDLLTHDACIVDLYCNDPLCTARGVSARLASEVLYAIDEAIAYATYVNIPFLLIRGAEDKVTLKPGIEQFFKSAKSADKTFTEIPGLYHEIFNETAGNAQGTVIDWLGKRMKQLNL